MALTPTTPARRIEIAPGTGARRSWETSQLRSLRRAELDAVIDVMPAWLSHREWHLPEEADSGLLWEFIERHGLGGALGSLAAEGLAPKGKLAEQAQERYFSNLLHYERAEATCQRIHDVAEKLGLPVLNLKGPALAEQAYGDGGIRSFSDIDLWTVSREGVFKLLRALDAVIVEDCDSSGVVRRVRAPGDVLARVDGWEIEIRSPTPVPTDPMLQLLAEMDSAEWLKADGGLAGPNASQHLLVLLLHMSWYHYFSRFVWFLDLAALMKRRRAEIDFEWVEHQARRLNAVNQLGVAARFCREQIDPAFPEFPIEKAAWNYRFLCSATEPRTIAEGRYSGHQRGLLGESRMFWFRAARHYLLSDPGLRAGGGGWAGRWLDATVTWGWQIYGRRLGSAIGWLTALLLYPAARVMAWISTMPQKRGGGS